MLKASYWIDLLERVIRSFAQGTLGGFGLGATVHPFTELPWVFALEMGVTTAVLCLLTCLTTIGTGDRKTASYLPPPEKTQQVVQRFMHHRDGDNGSPE